MLPLYAYWVSMSLSLWINEALHTLAACCPLFNTLSIHPFKSGLCDMTEQSWVFLLVLIQCFWNDTGDVFIFICRCITIVYILSQSKAD